MVIYRTEWTQVIKGKPTHQQYDTKSLTPYHKRLRESFPKARTLKLDTSVRWPFGCYAEVVA